MKPRFKTFTSRYTQLRAYRDIQHTTAHPDDHEAILYATLKGHKTYPSTQQCIFRHTGRRYLQDHACVSCMAYLRQSPLDKLTSYT